MEIASPPPTFCKPSAKCGGAALLQTPSELEQADFLAIDDLLDFSNDDIGGPIEPCLGGAASCELKMESPASFSLDRKLPSQPCAFGSDALCQPCDDLEELEWLSNFVEESFSSNDGVGCLGNFRADSGLGDGEKASRSRRSSSSSDELFRTTSPVSVLESDGFSREKHGAPFSFSPDVLTVPGRARSKRCRTAVCFWNTRILCSEVSESLLEMASTAYTMQAASADSSLYSSYYDYDEEGGDDDDELQADGDGGILNCWHPNQIAKYPSMKFTSSCSRKAKNSIKPLNPKPRKTKIDDPVATRKCLHCATQKTPQWRAGPLGPKTLCNACGVRYKSGRLCEEYRPAASPTFIESVHSNSHRKVLEMRKQKGDAGNGYGSSKLHRENGKKPKREISAVSSCAAAAIDQRGED